MIPIIATGLSLSVAVSHWFLSGMPDSAGQARTAALRRSPRAITPRCVPGLDVCAPGLGPKHHTAPQAGPPASRVPTAK